MPAIDQCEQHIVNALSKAGWVVTDRPFPIRVGRGEGVYADLRLRYSNERKNIVVVEVKCFSKKRSVLDEFYHAVGQYLLYRNALALKKLNFPLYLTVPNSVHKTFFNRKTVQAVIQDAKIKMIVVDFESEEIVTWTD